MTIKYEPVFGDQSLFDGAPEDAELAVKDNSDAWFYTVGKGRNTGLLSLDSSSIKIAMRRIIKTPTWTREDQEAGVLPPVGVKCLWVDKSGVPGKWYAVYPKEGTEVEIIAHYTNIKTIVVFIWIDEDGYTVNSCSCEVSDFSPIETPAEKAKREENEFVKSEMKNTTLSMEWSCVYERGLRAAYRKLKAPTND